MDKDVDDAQRLSKVVAAQPLPADGAATYAAVCSACHGAGIAGAPKAGDKAAWGPRIAQGKATLYKHELEGFQGGKGVITADRKHRLAVSAAQVHNSLLLGNEWLGCLSLAQA